MFQVTCVECAVVFDRACVCVCACVYRADPLPPIAVFFVFACDLVCRYACICRTRVPFISKLTRALEWRGGVTVRYRVEDELRFIELSARLSLARAGDPRTDGDLEKCEVRSETLLRKLSPSAIVRPGEALFTHDGA